jgi:hypothetical protein
MVALSDLSISLKGLEVTVYCAATVPARAAKANAMGFIVERWISAERYVMNALFVDCVDGDDDDDEAGR